MHRSTVGGKVRPSKKTTAAVTQLKYHCYNHPPFEEREYCLFSLKVVLHSFTRKCIIAQTSANIYFMWLACQ